MVYDGDGRVLDSLNNVMQARFCGGYYFGEIAGKRRNRILERPIWFRGRPLLEALNFAIFQEPN